MAQKPVLGKGLASLLPNAAMAAPIPPPAPVQAGTGAVSAGVPMASAAITGESSSRIPGITLAMIDEIQANHYQPRHDFDEQALNELADSIRANGIIQPLVVRKTDKGYELIAGERRLRAAKLAGLRQVPVVIRRSTDREALEMALVENIQRQNLNCIDEALAYLQLIQDFNLTQEEVSKRVGKERATVANHLRLLKLPEAIRDDLKRGILSFGHGKALLSSDDNDVRLIARAQVVEQGLSVRETEALVEQLKNRASHENLPKSEPKKPLTPLQERLANLGQDLTRQWSTRVELKGSDRRGKILIHYASRQELERILQAMQNKS